MPNFVFPLLCVSSADVDFWVNGGWDQPKCPKKVVTSKFRSKDKGKAVPLQGGFQKVKIPRFHDNGTGWW